MKAWTRSAMSCGFVAALLAASLPASADPEPADVHSGGAATAGDEHSQNIKLLGNSPGRGATNSDLAFDGNLLYAGDSDGFRILDVRSPARPRVLSEFDCSGSQGDVSVYRGLLFRSVDSPRSGPSCDAEAATASTPGAWEGVQVFDVSDPRNPEVVEFIKTDCGSHTHTLLPDGDGVFIYVSSYPLTPTAIGPESNCFDLETDPVEGGHGYVSVIEIPDVSDPSNFEVHRAFLDEANTELVTYDLDAALGLPPGTLGPNSFRACHDISVFVELELAAAACFRDGQLWDISDPINPELIWTFRNDSIDPADVDLWHSAAFSWDGTVVAFGDESGGGLFSRCTDPTDDQGRIWFVDIDSGDVVREDFLANYKIPRSEPGICTAHLFNFIPLRSGANVLVSSFNTGGTSVLDVDALIGGATEEEAEIGFIKPSGGSPWASYWHNGFIYANDRVRGVDVMLLSDKARAGAVKLGLDNPQTQESLIP
ncbi:MAG TPA: hypothetical protein VFZ37_14245 [Jiangellaceae bacterium]